MSGKFRGLYFYQIGFYMLYDPISHDGGEKIDNRGVNRCRRRKRPAGRAILLHNFRDVIGQLFVDPAIRLRFQVRPFRHRIHVPATATVADRKPASHVRLLVGQSAVRVGDVESLHELQMRPAGRRFLHPVGFQTAAINDDNKRARCHSKLGMKVSATDWRESHSYIHSLVATSTRGFKF